MLAIGEKGHKMNKEKSTAARMGLSSMTRGTGSVIRYKSKTMSIEEHVLCYYVVNLILFGEYNKAEVVILRNYKRMKLCSQVFHGNVNRYLGLSLLKLYEEQEIQKNLTNIPET